MAITIPSVDANTHTFATWVSYTNLMAQTISNSVVTANTFAGNSTQLSGSSTGNSTINYTARLYGTLIANTVTINNTLTGPTGANVTIQANVKVDTGSNLYTVGPLNVKGDIVIDTTAKLKFGDRVSLYAATNGWLKANSTGFVEMANLAVRGIDLSPNEFALTSTLGAYTNATSNVSYDVIAYSTPAGKWVRTTLTHLLAQEIDSLTLGKVTANASGSVTFNANVSFGGTSTSLFVSNTTARVGIGGITSPQAPLHVQGAVYATGDITAFYTSDRNLKMDIVRIDNALEKVRWLNGVEFTWDKNKIAELVNVGPKPDRDIGLIAQDVEKVLPQAVTDRGDGYKAVDYSRLVPVLVEAIKELSYRVNILEAELEDKYRSSSR